MRITIERLRTLVLAAGVLLVVALAAYLAVGKWRSTLSGRDLPRRLGANIQQEGRGITYTEAHGGHMLFKIHASRAEQLKNGHALLHDAQIEFFGQDGRSLDRISGSDFEYDQRSGMGTAAGRVEITLTQPQTAGANSGSAKLPRVPQAAHTVHVESSGVSFNQNTGVLTTAKPVNFTMAGGSGSALGARYDSEQGFLVLEHAVELNTMRGGRKVRVHAAHAEFERGEQVCRMTDANADFGKGQAVAGRVTILFGRDGSAQRLDAMDGFTLATTGGGRVTAPKGTLIFGVRNQPRNGEMQGGVKLESVSGGRQLQGSAPSAQMQFGAQGQIRHMALSQGVEISSNAQSGAGAQALRVARTWRSPVAQVDFRATQQGKVEPADLHGWGGVVVTSRTQRGTAAPVPAQFAADEVTGKFGPGAELTAMDGMGRAKLEQTLADGARQTASGDRIEARFAPAAPREDKAGAGQGAAEIQSAVLEGHVVIVQQPAQKKGEQAQPPLRATAGRATYAEAGQRLQLSQSPRVENGGLQLTGNTIDVSQQAGQAFAHGDVKATWLQQAGGTGEPKGASAGPGFGGQAPAHVVADEAQFSQAGGDAVFRGHARLWQGANSIAAPVIQLNRQKQTMIARSGLRGEPVQAVLLATGEAAAGMAPKQASQRDPKKASREPAVIRVTGREFTYSDALHLAVMTGAPEDQVVAEAGGAACRAQKVVLALKPRGSGNETAEVERVTASGDVVVSSQGRRGAGAKLVYSSLTGEYALTGTPAEPPSLTDPARGTVTGAALIFNSRNDSVSIEGRGHQTQMETTAPR